MKLFANLIFPIITIILVILNTYYSIFVSEYPWGKTFIWWSFSSVGLFFIMGIIRWYVEEKEKGKK